MTTDAIDARSHGMAVPKQRRGLLLGAIATQAALAIGLSAVGWGGWTALVAHPARAAFVVLTAVACLVAAVSPINLSSGEREDVEQRRAILPAAGAILVLTWLMPFMDRARLWTLDGDAVRWAGVALLAAGAVLRLWPVFVLGHRFSGLVAIQPGHRLVTDGPYRWVRHPSYLGMIVAMLGWALVFRSSVGVAATVLGLRPLVLRIDAEEELLASEFGRSYSAYRVRSWRLVPFVY